MNRTKLKNYAPQARRDFIQAMSDRAAYFGLTANKIEPSVFKRVRIVDGVRVEAKKYTIQYTDANGNTSRISGFTDKGRSWELARKLEAGAAVSDQIRHRTTALADHLAAYKKHLEAQNNSATYVQQTEMRIKAINEGCEFKTLRDLNLPDIEDWLARKREKKSFGIRTSNYYGRDFRSFLTWLVDSNRAEMNALARFTPLNAETDDGRERRALSGDEFAKLITTTRSAADFRGMSGADRAMLYVVAAYSAGNRRELRPQLIA